MNNQQFDEQPRRVVNADVGLNTFLTKMYGWMALAVLLSAVSAYFVSTNQALLSTMTGSGMWIGLIVWFIFPFLVNGQPLNGQQ